MFLSCVFFFYILLFIRDVFSDRRILNKDVDEVCVIGADPWICKNQNNCPTLRKALENNIRPDICSFVGNKAIFCCPPEKYISSLGSTTQSQPNVPAEKSSQNLAEENNNWRSSEPSAQSPEYKANKMCEEYSKHVNQTIVVPPTMPGQKSRTLILHECGFRPLIVGGEDAKPKEFPHMALIGERANKKIKIEWICGGSLISPKFVLTAAHCFSRGVRISVDPGEYWVRLGELDISSDKDDINTVDIKVAKTYIHPKFNDRHAYHDIALCELESEAQLSTYVRPLCLHTSKEVENDKVLASGWGHTMHRGTGSARLQKVILPSVSNRICNQTYSEEYLNVIPKGIVKDLMLCVGGDEGKDTCQGDSGGPLQILHKNLSCMYSIVGVVSYGKGCAFGYPSICTRVSNYVPWIVSIVWP